MLIYSNTLLIPTRPAQEPNLHIVDVWEETGEPKAKPTQAWGEHENYGRRRPNSLLYSWKHDILYKPLSQNGYSEGRPLIHAMWVVQMGGGSRNDLAVNSWPLGWEKGGHTTVPSSARVPQCEPLSSVSMSQVVNWTMVISYLFS